jgi:hypothetical protein
MYGGTSVTYNPPPPDTTFQDFLKAQTEKEARITEQAGKTKAEERIQTIARKKSGAAGLPALKQRTLEELNQGLITYDVAERRLSDYASKYDLGTAEAAVDYKDAAGNTVVSGEGYTPVGIEADISELSKTYSGLLPTRRKAGIQAAYEETLGRQASEEEISKAEERFKNQVYGSIDEFRDSLSKSPEYLEKFNQSYQENYYDTMFGKPIKDAKGKAILDARGNKQRAFKFDKSLLPKYSGDLESKTKITTPDFGSEFLGSVEEINQQIQNIRDTRQYLFSAGLTNLQGEIDKETQKLKNEGTKEVAKIGATGSIYSNLVSGFWG